jgi:quercetin dioxygenase-like cupin family protein
MSDVCRKEKFWFLDTLITFNVAEADNADRISVIEHRGPYGSSPPLHVHHTEDEVFHVLAGEARFNVGGREVQVHAGDTLAAPKGVPHTYVITSPEGAGWLTVTRRGDFERMVRKIARPAEHEGLPPHRGAPSGAEAAALEAACRAHGISLIGPPMIVDRTQGAAA